MDFNNLKEKITKKHIIIGTSAIVLIAGAITAGVTLSGDSDKENTGSNLVAEVTETATTTAVTTTTAPQTTTTVATTTTKVKTTEKKKEEKKEETKTETKQESNTASDEGYYEEPKAEEAPKQEEAPAPEPEPEYVPDPEPETPVETPSYGSYYTSENKPQIYGFSIICGFWYYDNSYSDWLFEPGFSDGDATEWVISTGFGKPSGGDDGEYHYVDGYVWLN